MTTDWLKEAREIAERAARYFKGQHWYDPHGLMQIGFDEEEVHHIAKFDPQTVLAMLEVAEVANRENKTYLSINCDCARCCSCQNNNEALEAAIENLRKVIGGDL